MLLTPVAVQTRLALLRNTFSFLESVDLHDTSPYFCFHGSSVPVHKARLLHRLSSTRASDSRELVSFM